VGPVRAKVSEIQQLADQMVRLGLIQRGDVGGLVEDRFAASCPLGDVTSLEGILEDVK